MTNCRVLKSCNCRITQYFKPGVHLGIDLVKHYSELDHITAHSDGEVVEYRTSYYTTDREGNSYGNYVKIKHPNGYYTLYAHMQYKSVTVKTGDKVKKGQVIGYMGNTGHSYGGHLHFEVIKGNEKIDPYPYLNCDLPGATQSSSEVHKYKIGDTVRINGVYVSSSSDTRLTPAKTKGKITRIVDGARNPYLLDGGNIGWINDNCIVSKVETITYMTISNCSYLNLRTSASYGNNIYKSVKAGTKVEYHGMYNGWARVKYDNKTLYCGKSYLK